MDLSGLKIFLNLIKISLKVTVKEVMKDIFLSLMLNIPKICMKFVMTYHFCLKLKKINKAKKLVTYLGDKKIYYAHKKSKATIESRINFENNS